MPRLTLISIALVVACGGTAVIDREEESSGGGNGGVGNQGPGQGGASSSNGGAGGGLSQACASACSIIDTCRVGDPGSCQQQCEKVNENCAAPYLSYLQCVAATAQPGSCDAAPSCVSALSEWQACEAWCVERATCQSTGNDCFCQSSSCGPAFQYQIACAPTGTCECLIDMLPVGSCVDQDQSCDGIIGASCCATLFWVPGGGL